MNHIRQIDSELRELELRRKGLIEEREELLAAPAVTEHPSNSSALTPDEKIALFLSLFRCRGDVYPRLWENAKTGKKGYSPGWRNEWSKVVCEKPRVKCSECPNQAFPALDEAGILFRDFTPARVSGAVDFGNGPTEPDQPYRMEDGRKSHSVPNVPPWTDLRPHR